jgi:replicative DNA helicase
MAGGDIVSETVERMYPNSQLAEQSVLGAILVDNESIYRVIDAGITSEDFYFPQNKEVFSAMMDLFHTSRPLDLVTVSNQLKQRNSLEAVGGVEYLAYIATLVPTTANLTSYIKIVRDKSELRTLIHAANKVINICYDENNDIDFILEDATRIIFEVLQQRANKGYEHIKPIVAANYVRLNELAQNPDKMTGVPTGFSDLDRVLSGLQNGNLILVAARPGMGKTSFALNIMQNAAILHNVTSVMFSLEMSKEELANRILSAEANVESGRMRSADLDESDFKKLALAIPPISNAPIFLDDTPGISISEIRAKCKRLKLEHNLGLVVIDYLQLMQSSRRAENRQQEISEISRGLKMLAKELDVPVIACSQLSRQPEARQDKRPLLSDLRESGAIEQDADVVMMLYRDDYYNDDAEERNVAECIIAKHRNGETTKVKLTWIGEYTKFGNYYPEN